MSERLAARFAGKQFHLMLAGPWEVVPFQRPVCLFDYLAVLGDAHRFVAVMPSGLEHLLQSLDAVAIVDDGVFAQIVLQHLPCDDHEILLHRDADEKQAQSDTGKDGQDLHDRQTPRGRCVVRQNF